MRAVPKIAFIGAGSTVFMKNLVGDLLGREALKNVQLALMDIDSGRLEDAQMVATKLVRSLAPMATVTAHSCQREAVDGADFVIVAFQIGGYKPGTVTDFAIPKKFGLRQTIGDSLGIGGIMRGLRTVPHLWQLCADMSELCPDAVLLQYVNPMAINMWAIAERFPKIHDGRLHCRQVNVLVALNDVGKWDDATMVIPGSHESNIRHAEFDNSAMGGEADIG